MRFLRPIENQLIGRRFDGCNDCREYDGQDSKSLYEARRSFPKRYESEKGADRLLPGLLLSDTLVIGRGIAGWDA